MAFQTVAQQEKLKARSATYWHRLATGQHLGLRKTRTAMTWLARAYDPLTRKQVKHSLGDFAHLQPNERYSAASRAAHEWFKHLEMGGSSEVITVERACELYAAGLDSEVKTKEARRRFAQYVNGDPIARVPLPKLRKVHLQDWRKRLAAMPAAFQRAGKKGVGRGRGKGTVTRPRAAATLERDIATLRAALNKALESGYVTSSLAWAEALKSNKVANRRTIYLEREQRLALLTAIEDVRMREFFAVLAVLPLRPGALAALTVADFDAKQSTLRIGKDKAHAGRIILIPENVAAMLTKAAQGKQPSDALLARADGTRWRKDEWGKAMRSAAIAADLPAQTVAYSLRHSAITDLVTANLDVPIIAAISGTSPDMIYRHYWHLRQDAAREALSLLALTDPRRNRNRIATPGRDRRARSHHRGAGVRANKLS